MAAAVAAAVAASLVVSVAAVAASAASQAAAMATALAAPQSSAASSATPISQVEKVIEAKGEYLKLKKHKTFRKHGFANKPIPQGNFEAI